MIDATITSTSNSLIDRRFSTALWELLFIVIFGLTLFSLIYCCISSSSLSTLLNSSQHRLSSYTKSDHSMVPTILIPPTSNILIESMCIHESGTVLVVAYSDGSLTMWNSQTGGILFNQQRSIMVSEKILNHVWCSIMLDENRCLLGCSDGNIEFYSIQSRSKPWIFSHGDLGGITHLIRASSTIIIGTTRRGYLISLEYFNSSIREIYIKRLHQWPIRVCLIDLNSSLIFTGSDDHSIKVANLVNGQCLHTLHKHQGPVNCLIVDPVSWIDDFFLK